VVAIMPQSLLVMLKKLLENPTAHSVSY
jgi:hypothetical protein